MRDDYFEDRNDRAHLALQFLGIGKIKKGDPVSHYYDILSNESALPSMPTCNFGEECYN